MPGLVDGHVHLVDPQAGVARWSMPRYLAWGVTTVRDMHGPLRSVLAVRRELDRGWRPGPRVYSAGAMIDGVPPTYPDAITARTAKDARRGVDRLVNAGADLVKVYTRVDKTLLGAAARRGAHLQPPRRGAPRPHRRGDGRAPRAGLARAPERDPRGGARPIRPPLYAAHERRSSRDGRRSSGPGPASTRRRSARVAGVLAARNVIVVPTLVLHETFSRLDDPGGAGRHDAARPFPRRSSGGGTSPT